MKQMVDFDSDSTDDNPFDQLKLVSTKGTNAVKVYTFTPEDPTVLDNESITTTVETFKSKSAGYYATEVLFETDFNGDGIIGKDDFAELDAVGTGGAAITAQYDVDKNASYTNASDDTFSLFAKNGKKQLKSVIGKFELAGAGTVDDTFQTVYVNSKTNDLQIFSMEEVTDSEDNVTGQKVTGKATKVSSKKSKVDYAATETAFGLDLDGDGYIGKDTTANGLFNDEDLTTVEEEGSLGSYTD